MSIVFAFTQFALAALQNIWSRRTQCSHSFGGSLDSIGYRLVGQLWQMMRQSFTGNFFVVLPWLSYYQQPFHFFSFTHTALFSQAHYIISGIWCVLCCYLRCGGLHYRYSCMLLSSMYHCNPICCSRSSRLLLHSHIYQYLACVSVVFSHHCMYPTYRKELLERILIGCQSTSSGA